VIYNKHNYIQTWQEITIRKKNSEYWNTILECSVNDALTNPDKIKMFQHQTSDRGTVLVRLV